MSLDVSQPRLAELKLQDAKHSAFLFSLLDKTSLNQLHLKLIVGDDVFVGSFDLSSVSPLHDALDDPEDGSNTGSSSETLKALRGNHDSQYLFKLDQKTKLDATLTWFCEVDGTCLQIGAASLRLQIGSDAASELGAVLSHATSSINAAKEENLRLEKENLRLESDRKKLVERSRKVVEKAKEDDLFKKFVLVLNEKKSEIRRLRRLLGGPDVVEAEDDQGVVEDDGNKKTPDAGSSGDYEGDTDVDSDGEVGSEPSIFSRRKKSPPSLDEAPSCVVDAPLAKKSKDGASCSDGTGKGDLKPFSFARKFLNDSSDEED